MQTTEKQKSLSFKDWLLWGPRNKVILFFSIIAIFTQFFAFKYFYPFASYIHGDSFSYLNAAYKNLSINTYMIGYSMFLRFFSIITSSDTALVAIQYLLLQGSSLFFLLTIFYFYRPRQLTRGLLFCFMLFNPLFLYMANLISSDALFLALSLVWFTLLLWIIIYFPSTMLLILHTFILYIAFTVRYNALIYPFIGALAIGFSNLSLRKKIAGIAAPLLLTGAFILYTCGQYKALTGTWQYSPFSGWQMTNNAMYAYRYVDSAKRKPVPAKFKALDNMIRTYFDSTRDIRKHPQEALEASTVYMWAPQLTLYKYRNMQFTKDSTTSEFKRWASMGPFYAAYGAYIIRQYPWQYVQHFLWPNTQKYYAPPVEFLATYNSDKDSTAPIALKWFGYKSLRLKARAKNLDAPVLEFYPILSGIINVVMLLGLLCFILLKGYLQNTTFRKGILLAGAVWIINAAFTIFASSAALRFQSFPILLTTSFTALIIEWLWNMASTKQESTQPLIAKS